MCTGTQLICPHSHLSPHCRSGICRYLLILLLGTGSRLFLFGLRILIHDHKWEYFHFGYYSCVSDVDAVYSVLWRALQTRLMPWFDFVCYSIVFSVHLSLCVYSFLFQLPNGGVLRCIQTSKQKSNRRG